MVLVDEESRVPRASVSRGASGWTPIRSVGSLAESTLLVNRYRPYLPTVPPPFMGRLTMFSRSVG